MTEELLNQIQLMSKNLDQIEYFLCPCSEPNSSCMCFMDCGVSGLIKPIIDRLKRRIDLFDKGEINYLTVTKTTDGTFIHECKNCTYKYGTNCNDYTDEQRIKGLPCPNCERNIK